MTKIRALLTDIDGVIVLSEDLHKEKIFEVARDPLRLGDKVDPALGVVIDIAAVWNTQLSGIGDHRVYEWICAKNENFPLSEEHFLSACEMYYLENAKNLKMRPTYAEAFDYFEACGLKMAAVSSGVRAQVDSNLAAAGIIDRLMFSESADDVEPGKTKPHPAPYLNALKKMNNSLRAQDLMHVDILPAECLVIEDTASGAKSGAAAGMKTVHWKLEAGQAFCPEATFKLDTTGNLYSFAKSLMLADNSILKASVKAAPRKDA